MCDGHPFASTLFRRLAGRGSFFRGFVFRWALQFVFCLVHCLTLRDAAPRSRKGSLYECSRPCDTLSCLFVTALWLRQRQSILIQLQQTNDIDRTCYTPLPTKSVTCLQVGPMSLEWPAAPIAGSDPSSPSSSHEDPNDECPEGALVAPPHSRWRRDALQPPQIQRVTLGRNTCVHVPGDGLRCVTWNTRGLIGTVTSSQISRGRKQPTYRKTTIPFAFKKYMRKISFSRSFRYWPRDVGCVVHFYQATQMQEARPYAFIKIYCLTMPW